MEQFDKFFLRSTPDWKHFDIIVTRRLTVTSPSSFGIFVAKLDFTFGQNLLRQQTSF